jgi:O-antigen ligase
LGKQSSLCYFGNQVQVFSPFTPGGVTPFGSGREYRATPIGSNDQSNPLQIFGLFFGLSYIFIRFSMIHEALAWSFGVQLYLLYIFAPPAFLAVVITGGIPRTFRMRPTFYWLAFALWMVFITPFSQWRGGSFDVVEAYLKNELPLMFVLGGLLVTWKNVKTALYVLAAACLTDLFIAKTFLKMGEGRAQLEMTGSSIANSNDLAGHLLLLTPFLIFVYLNRQLPGLIRWLMVPAIGFSLYIILGSASRGAFVGVGASCLFILLRVSGAKRLLGIILIPIVCGGLFFLLPQETRSRLLNFSSDNSIDAGEAAQSAAWRKEMLIKSLQYTVEHPIFGLGPGQFVSFNGGQSLLKGQRGSWIQTHNVYTQISSECGIPGVILYVCGIVSSFLLINRIRKKAETDPVYSDIAAGAFSISLALVGFGVAITFLTLGYRFYLPAMAGLIVSFACAAEKEFIVRKPVTAPNTLPGTQPNLPPHPPQNPRYPRGRAPQRPTFSR